jgi:ABC-type transporter Mla subunit MlaD
MAKAPRPIRRAPKIPKSRRNDVTRAEFDRVIDLLNQRGKIINDILQQVEKNTHNAEVEFARFAQVQADLDQIKRTLAKLTAV